jgi:glycosyltransferase involved in cell wall biosynthesis
MVSHAMNLLNINSELTLSRNFNSYEWTNSFLNHGIDSKLLLLTDNQNYNSKKVINPNVSWNSGSKLKLKNFFLHYERTFGYQNRFQFWNRNIIREKDFIDSDIVHIHLVQGGHLDWKTIKRITRLKPTVWTWHDPWPLTGHCVYPGDCPGFKRKCQKCPDLFRNFEIYKDRTSKNRAEKYQLLSQLPIQVHFASNWMRDLYINSGLSLINDPVVIPLPTKFQSQDKYDVNSKFRSLHSIEKETLIIGLRDTKQFQKNSIMIQRLLIDLTSDINVAFVTVDGVGLLDQFKDKFKIIELGYLNDHNQLNFFYKGIDLFLNLSLDEAYGMMAAESLSSGTPVVTKSGTATEEFISRDNGYVVTTQSELNALIINLANKIKNSGGPLIENMINYTSFDVDFFTNSMIKIYRNTIEKFYNAD